VLNDDRQVEGGFRQWANKLTPNVAMLLKRHAGKNPKHYTIADSKPVGELICKCQYAKEGAHLTTCPIAWGSA
jgi:hypothetical protein